MPDLGARGCGHGFSPRPCRCSAGIDAGCKRVAVDLCQERLSQFDRVDAALVDLAPQFGGGHVGPGSRHGVPPVWLDRSGLATHGQSGFAEGAM